jgi:hypothetical protein
VPSRSVAALAAALLLGACGGGGSDDAAVDGDGAGRSTSTEVAQATPTSGAITGSTDDHEGLTDLEVLAPQLLIAPGELGVADVQDLGYTPPGPSQRCAFHLDRDQPADVHVGTTLLAGGVTIINALRVYADAAAASAAYDAWVAAEPGCRPANPAVVGPTDVNTATNVNAAVGADASMSFTTSLPSGDDVLVVALVGDAVISVAMTGVSAGAGGTVALPPLDVAAFAVGKVLAALES